MLPPTPVALMPHIARANYTAVRDKSYITSRAVLPPIDQSGWNLENGVYVPVRCLVPPAPTAVLELTKCGCKAGCTGKCSCCSDGLPCTPLSTLQVLWWRLLQLCQGRWTCWRIRWRWWWRWYWCRQSLLTWVTNTKVVPCSTLWCLFGCSSMCNIMGRVQVLFYILPQCTTFVALNDVSSSTVLPYSV